MGDRYSAKQFFQDIKSADRSRKFKSCNEKKRKAYSQGDVNDLADDLLMVAENEGKFYEKKDAAGAVEYARKQWIRTQQDEMFSMSKEAAKIATKELIKEWKDED